MDNSTLVLRKINLEPTEEFLFDCVGYDIEITKKESRLDAIAICLSIVVVICIFALTIQDTTGIFTKKSPVMIFELIVFICCLCCIVFCETHSPKVTHILLTSKQQKSLRKWSKRFILGKLAEIYEFNGQMYKLKEDKDGNEVISCIGLLSDENKQILKDNPDCGIFSVKWNENKSDWILEKSCS